MEKPCTCPRCLGVPTADPVYGFDLAMVPRVRCLHCRELIGHEPYELDTGLARFGTMLFVHTRCRAKAQKDDAMPKRSKIDLVGEWKEMGKSPDGGTVHLRHELTGKFFLHVHVREGSYSVELATCIGARKHKKGGVKDLREAERWAVLTTRRETARLLREASKGGPRSKPVKAKQQ